MERFGRWFLQTGRFNSGSGYFLAGSLLKYLLVKTASKSILSVSFWELENNVMHIICCILWPYHMEFDFLFAIYKCFQAVLKKFSFANWNSDVSSSRLPPINPHPVRVQLLKFFLKNGKFGKREIKPIIHVFPLGFTSN